MSYQMFDCWPSRVITGAGASADLGKILKDMGKSRVMFITDRGLSGFDWVQNMVESLRDSGFEVAFYGNVGPNPVTELVEAARDMMLELKPDVIVALGGGSPMDAAKAANVIYTYGGRVQDYTPDKPAGQNLDGLLDIVAIPTTAGTGSEVTQIAVITDAEAKIKFGLAGAKLIPTVQILDPALTVTLPGSMTAFTGVDALTHCIEAYLSVIDFPPSNAIALEGIRMITEALPKAVDNGEDMAAREQMLTASFMGGMSFTYNMLGVCHACAHAMSAVYDTAHGLANAVLLAETMKINKAAKAKKLGDIARAMGGDTHGLTADEAADLAIELVVRLCRRVGIPEYLDDIGIKKEDVSLMAGKAIMDGCAFTNPVPVTKELCEKIYNDCFRD